ANSSCPVNAPAPTAQKRSRGRSCSRCSARRKGISEHRRPACTHVHHFYARRRLPPTYAECDIGDRIPSPPPSNLVEKKICVLQPLELPLYPFSQSYRRAPTERQSQRDLELLLRATASHSRPPSRAPRGSRWRGPRRSG